MSHLPNTSDQIRVECAASPEFQGWLARSGGSLVVSTYQAGKLAMIGHDGRQLTLLMRHFEKPLGLSIRESRLALATRDEITVFANAPLLAHDYLENQPGRYDGLYLPRSTYHTGDLHAHDVEMIGEEIVFANTRFSCLARVSRDFHFEPIWKPPFISDLAPEDRCHLNGLAVVDGKPRYVTALGTTDTAGGWREGKASGGVLIDVTTDEIILSGLSMPHSPRWHDGRLWLLNSGRGELLALDVKTRSVTTVCSLQGYLRGLCFVGPYALVGLCKIREKHIFGGLPIQDGSSELRCGVAVVDLRSTQQVGMFEFTAGCEELYDVEFLPGIRRPSILNLERPEIRQAVTNPESSYWLRSSSEIVDTTDAAASTPTAADEKDVRGSTSFPAGGELRSEGSLLSDTGTQL